MDFSLYIARRYLISKKSHNIINIISAISIGGISVGTMALIIVLSVFNGFEDLVSSLFNTFDPDLKIEAKEGKTFNISDFPKDSIYNLEGVERLTEVVEENVLLKYRSRQYIVSMKGLSSDYEDNNRLDSMIVEGELRLGNAGRPFAVVGLGVAWYLGMQLQDYLNPLEVYVPKRRNKAYLDISQAFNRANISPSGIFSIQQDFDSRYILVPIGFARELLEYTNECTSLEAGLKKGVSLEEIQAKIQGIAGDAYSVKNRYQQQEMLYKIMKSEKLAIFLILSFIILLATFNTIGSLSMLILDKKRDISILNSMGASFQLIRKSFLKVGILISLAGAAAGLLLGSLLCFLQTRFGLIKLNGGSGSFVIENYPVKMEILDFIWVFLIVSLIGFLASLIPVKNIKAPFLTKKA